MAAVSDAVPGVVEGGQGSEQLWPSSLQRQGIDFPHWDRAEALMGPQFISNSAPASYTEHYTFYNLGFFLHQKVKQFKQAIIRLSAESKTSSLGASFLACPCVAALCNLS